MTAENQAGKQKALNQRSSLGSPSGSAILQWLDEMEDTRTVDAPAMVVAMRHAVSSGELSGETLEAIEKMLSGWSCQKP